MSEAYGTAVDATDGSSLRDGLKRILDAHRDALDLDRDTVILPDAHYPFDPTTGQVTNPAVVAGLVETLAERLSMSELAIGYGEPAFVDGERAMRYLGYEEIAADTGIELLDVTSDELAPIDEDSPRSELMMPESLLDRQIVVVPTLRGDRETTVTGATTTLTSIAVPERTVSPKEIARVTACLDPAFSVFDLTYIHAGHPWKLDALVGSDDVAGLDATIGAGLCGLSQSDMPHLSATEGGRWMMADLSFVDAPDKLGSIGDDIGDDAGILRLGYELYAAVSGDAVPPHILD